MHIPDGFLDWKTAAAGAALSAAGLTVALRQARQEATARRVPLMGLSASFLFVAQMLNFPVVAGTSGHLMGGALAAILLGPAAAVVAMTCVLVLQCLLFADGGLLALGANVWNMAILGPLVASAVYGLVRRLVPGRRGLFAGGAIAAWCSVVASAVSSAGQLALSGTVAWSAALPAMTLVHMLIGLGEAVITVGILAAVLQTRPEFIEGPDLVVAPGRLRSAVGLALLVVLGLAVFVAPFASTWPDGLERVAEALGVGTRAAAGSPAPMPLYLVPGIRSAGIATALAAIVGIGGVYLLTILVSRILRPRNTA